MLPARIDIDGDTAGIAKSSRIAHGGTEPEAVVIVLAPAKAHGHVKREWAGLQLTVTGEERGDVTPTE